MREKVDFLQKSNKILNIKNFSKLIKTSYKAHIKKLSRRSLIKTEITLGTSKHTLHYQILMALN